MTDQTVLAAIGVLALILFAWWARGFWDQRRQNAVPRLLAAAGALIHEAAQLSHVDPNIAAKSATVQAGIEATVAALKDAVSKL